jgi:hypothetical protein
MKQQSATRLRLTRYAWMAAFVVVLRLAAWDLHHVLDLHDWDATTHCDVCMVVERGGEPLVSSSVTIPATPLWSAPLGRLPVELRATPAPRPPSRGPPSFLS